MWYLITLLHYEFTTSLRLPFATRSIDYYNVDYKRDTPGIRRNGLTSMQLKIYNFHFT